MSIEARELTKVFADRMVVERVSFTVEPGEIFGLIGPNGAGKTTTLRMLCGLMRPSAGRAVICGQDMAKNPLEAKARLGFATSTTGLYARLTCDELLDFFGRLNGLDEARLKARKESLYQVLEIEHLRRRLCGKLSTGERQRVSLARATLHDPEVLMLDEPTAGLDVLASRFVAEFIRNAAARGRSVLFSTHYMTEAELLCRRVGCIHGGRLIWLGPPAELRRELGAVSLEEAFLALIRQQPRGAENGAPGQPDEESGA